MQRKPEVMVKVSGSARGRKHIREHLAYITRNGKLEAERENGEILVGSQAVKEVANEWWQLRGADRKQNARDTINVVLSMPAGTDRDAFAAAASAFARSEFGGLHDYLIVHHTDTDHPHAHLTIRNIGFNGQCLDPRKDDLQRWRERLAEALRARGIEAEATPRRARGITRKGMRQAIKHMDKRKASTVTKWKIQNALKTVAAGDTGATPAWEAASQRRQGQIKAAWNTVARALDESGDVSLAVQVRAFVANLQSAPTERQALIAHAREAIARAEAQRQQQDQERRR
ncbi:MAG: relaxase/mobilization nuclease domain-containing protein [Burkholderiales bacterium]|nr:relaxase/mobilization nuclease domain-containing protein [Burkholderiales bacterium]